MTLSSLALKALIGFNLGLNANILPSQVLGDSVKTKKTNCGIKNTKSKSLERIENNKTQVNVSPSKPLNLIDSCGKCGRG